MNKTSLATSATLLFSFVGGCSDATTPAPGQSLGGAGSANLGTAGMAGMSAAGSSSLSGAGGMGGGSAGMGGASAGMGGAGMSLAGAAGMGLGGMGGMGGMGTAGMAAAGASGCEELGSPGTTGRQCDPTTQGNGTFAQEEPDGMPPEAEGEPSGELSTVVTYQSEAYGYGFPYRIYVPTQYEAGKAAALLIFQDGGNYTGNFRVPQVMDSLIESGEMPVGIAVFIEPGQERSEEYDTRDDKYARFLLEEFLPDVVLPNYDIVDDPNGWLIGGHSSGGACAFNAGWQFPDKFRKIMTHSGSFIALQDPGNDEYPEIVSAEPAKPLRVNLLSGTNDLECCGDTWFNANNNMAMSLETAGYAYRYLHSTTTHDPNPWATADFPAAMRWMWRGYTLPHYAQ